MFIAPKVMKNERENRRMKLPFTPQISLKNPLNPNFKIFLYPYDKPCIEGIFPLF